ncbi:hypothetical protein [Roseicitreum antarcticum]|uniref:hypothetical protein n=1 Tax=Roseicitreum antarcticum TaxID=564137 RepID=UPI000B281012|nr:hypothetical protein [Roseicitreum antarcticum]
MFENQERIDRGIFNVIHVVQGSQFVSDEPNTVLTTILGSCVATCITDPVRGVGGMNHFLLPEGSPDERQQMRYGSHAMELLINGLLKMGARKDRMEAKLFGGAMMHDGLGKIGPANMEFAQKFLVNEGIRCVAKSLGGTDARRIRYVPTTGQARQMIVRSSEVLVSRSSVGKSNDDDGITIF